MKIVETITVNEPTWFIIKDKQGNYVDNGTISKELAYNGFRYDIETFTDYQAFVDRLAIFNITIE